MIRAACALALVGLMLVLAMCFWPDVRIVIACMFVGQTASGLGIALFLSSAYGRASAGGEQRDR